MTYVTIDWGTVQVTAGASELFDIAVQLAGSPDDAWRRGFNSVADEFVNRDASGHFGADWTIAPVTDASVKVGGVRPGQEEDVKDKLGTIVDHANALVTAAINDEPDAAEDTAQADAMARRLRGD
jgi:hypothetical protein